MTSCYHLQLFYFFRILLRNLTAKTFYSLNQNTLKFLGSYFRKLCNSIFFITRCGPYIAFTYIARSYRLIFLGIVSPKIESFSAIYKNLIPSFKKHSELFDVSIPYRDLNKKPLKRLSKF